MKYKVVAHLDEQKYKSSPGMDPDLWPMLKDKLYTLNIYRTRDWAEWSADSHRKHIHSNLDLDTIRIVEVDE